MTRKLLSGVNNPACWRGDKEIASMATRTQFTVKPVPAQATLTNDWIPRGSFITVGDSRLMVTLNKPKEATERTGCIVPQYGKYNSHARR